MVAASRRYALAGHDLPDLLDRAIAHRPLDDANSIAGVLHWRLDQLAPSSVPVRPAGRPGTLSNLPKDPYRDIAEEAAKLIDLEEARIHAEYAAGAGEPPNWARSLGDRPPEPAVARAWVDAIAAVDIYRRTYELEPHVDLLGPAPSIQRPDAARAYTEAQRLCDNALGRHFERLDVTTRDALLERQRDLLSNAPPFDPAELAAIHRQLTAAQQTSQGVDPKVRVQLHDLEQRAAAYSRWLNQAATARQLLRAAEQPPQVAPPTLQTSRGR